MKSQKNLKSSKKYKITCSNKNTYIGKLFGISKSHSNIYFETRFGIHTFGLNSSISVIILDKGDYIVAIKRNLKPNRLWFWNIKYNRVIEVIRDSNNKSITNKIDSLSVGDQVILSIA